MIISSIWILIGIIIIAVVSVVKVTSKKQELAVKAVLILFIFLILGAGYVYMSHDIDLTSADGVLSGFQIYFSWLKSIFINLKSSTSYVIHQNWGITNSTS